MSKRAAEWFKPDAPAAPSQLMINNSMTKSLVPFHPMEGNLVKWYSCGPTVYDAAHVGHARAAVTFDILRRIMQDYFMFDVFFVMNITDVEDKIIVRARRNHYIAEYERVASDLTRVTADAEAALALAVAESAAKVATVTAQLETADDRFVTDLKDLLQQAEYKAAAAVKDQAAFPAIAAAAAASSDKPAALASIINAARAALAAKLDADAAASGADSIDHSIFKALTVKFEREYFADMAALGVREPDALTRVTEYVPQIVAFVEKIVAKGLAYDDGAGSVYFDTVAFSTRKDEAGHCCHHYGKLNPAGVGNAELAAEGEGALTRASVKKHPNDFALWKASQPGEPQWDSPWGRGRPGWHIECSVMATDLLGDQFDIHTGGEDLKFPHHDNELAQSEAFSGRKQWVNYFMHAGHLHIQGLRMSKSLKNFITIRQALADYTPRQLRLLFLMQRWDARMNYGDESLADACNRERTLKEFFMNINNVAKSAPPLSTVEQTWTDEDRALRVAFDGTQGRVHAALLENLNYTAAMTEVFALITVVNKYLTAAGATAKVLMLRRIAAFVDKLLKVFGVVRDEEAGFLQAIAAGAGAGGDAAGNAFAEEVVDKLCEFRDTVRRVALASAPESLKKDIMIACDDFRDEALPLLGIRLEDKPGGGVWKRDNAVELLKQIAEKKLGPLLKKIGLKADLLPKVEQTVARPAERLFQTGEHEGKFSAYDAAGVPTHDAAGAELDAPARKRLANAVATAKKTDDQVRKAMVAAKASEEDGPAGFLAGLKAEIAALEEQYRLIAEARDATIAKVNEKASAKGPE
jgi:cysteinyl-tRNA synthetase